MPKKDQDFFKNFQEYHDQKKDSDRILGSFPFIDIDSYYQAKKNNPRWEQLALTHFAYQGIEKQYGTVNPKDPQQQRSFVDYVYFHKNGQLKTDGDYKTHLAILSQSYAADEKRQTYGQWVGKMGDVGAMLAEDSPHRLAKFAKYAWSFFGDDIKNALKGDEFKESAEIASQYIQLHAKNEVAISALMKIEFPFHDTHVQKTLWEQNLKKVFSQDAAKNMAQEVIAIVQKKLAEQVRNGRQLNKEEIQLAIAEEFSKHSADLSGELQDLTQDLRQQVNGLVDQFSQHLQTLEQAKHANANFVYNDNEIRGLATCAQFLGQMAVFIELPELKQAAIFVQGVAGVADSINKLNQLKTLTDLGPMALAGGYAAVGIAVFALVSSFMDQGPSADQLILESIQKLTTFIADEFKKVHEELHTIHKDMIQGFNSMLEACQKIFDLSLDTLKAVHGVGEQIQQFKEIVVIKLDEIKAEIDILRQFVDAGLHKISEDKFKTNLRLLDDLQTGQNKNYNQIQALMNELVGDHLRGSSPVDFYTGAYYFKTVKNHHLAANHSQGLYFSAKRSIDTRFVSEDRRQLANKINSIIQTDRLTALMGFFAKYAHTILYEDYQSLESIQQELTAHTDAIKNLDTEIKKNQKKIAALSKKQTTETEKKQLAQEQVNLANLQEKLASTQNKKNTLLQLESVAKKAQEHNDQYQQKVNAQIDVAVEKQKLLEANMALETKHLAQTKETIRLLQTGFEFLYAAEVTPELTELLFFYQDVYESLDCFTQTKPLPQAAKSLLYEQLGLVTDPKNGIGFAENNDFKDGQANAYRNALEHIHTLFIQQKKIEVLALENKILGSEIEELKASLALASAYHRKSLAADGTDGLVFNPKLWILGVYNYLKLIQNPSLSLHYEDNHLAHAQQLIVMGKNFLHFIHVLRNSPKLYEELWLAYANTLLAIHAKYQQDLAHHFNSLQDLNSYHLQNEIVVNPSLVLDTEVLFANEKLTDASFDKLLDILDAQKITLQSFYQLIRPNVKVMELVFKLWDKTALQEQLTHLAAKQRDNAAFTTLMSYQYVNKAKLDLTNFQAKSWEESEDIIGTKTIASLVAYLEWHVKQVTLRHQKKIFELNMPISMDRLPMELTASNPSTAGKKMKRNDFECLVNAALEQANMEQSENAVFFFGLTRAGKSTFISYLLGCDLVREETLSSDNKLIATNCPVKAPTIGHEPVPQTLFPSGYLDKEAKNLLVDFPGTEDSRTPEEALLGVLATQVAIKTTKLIKQIVLVVDHYDIKNKNAQNLAKLASSMSKIFQNFEQNKDKITLVVSKLQFNRAESQQKQKDRIREDLKQFKAAIEKGVYSQDITDKGLVKDFLSIFIDQNSHLVLFDTSNAQARDDLLARFALLDDKKFSSKQLAFVSDDKHRSEFFMKIQGALQQASTVLNTLLQHPDKKATLEKDLTQVEQEISTLNAQIKISQEEPIESPAVTTFTEEQIQAKHNDISELDLALLRLTAREAVLINEIANIEKRTELVKSDVLPWREEEHYPGAKGYPRSHQITLSRSNNNPYAHYTEEYFGSCQRKHIMYTVVDRICATYDDADNYKDGTIRCNTEGDVIVGTEWDRCWTLKEWYQKRTKMNANPRGSFDGKICKYRDEKAGTNGHIVNSGGDGSRGTYQVTYNTPNACYGHITVTFYVHYRDQPHIIEEVNGLKAELKQVQANISETQAQKTEARTAISNMEQQNKRAIEAQEKSQRKAQEKAQKIQADQASLATAKHKNSTLVTQLADSKTLYDNNLKTFCSNQAFWQRLIDLKTVVEFNFEHYTEFSQQFAKVVSQITAKECEGLIETLDCQNYEEQPADNTEHGKEKTTFVEHESSASTCGAEAAKFSIRETQTPYALLLQTSRTLHVEGTLNIDDAQNTALVTTHGAYSHSSQHNSTFDKGAWDPVIHRDATTGEPIFIYRVYQQGKEVGSASFYKHPLLCRSESGDRHNIIASTGILSNIKLDAHSLEEVCESLPPTMFERVIGSAQQGAKHGSLRGLANVVGYTLQAHNVPKHIAHHIQQATYLAGYFALRYQDYLSQQENTDWHDIFNATCKAAFDTGSVWLANQALSWFCQKANQLGKQAQQHGWAKTGSMFKFFGNAAPHAVLAHQVYNQGVLEVATSIASGVAAQTAVEQTCKLF